MYSSSGLPKVTWLWMWCFWVLGLNSVPWRQRFLYRVCETGWKTALAVCLQSLQGAVKIFECIAWYVAGLTHHPCPAILLVFQTLLWWTALHILCQVWSIFQTPLLHHPESLCSAEGFELYSSNAQRCLTNHYKTLLPEHIHSTAHTSGSCSHQGQDQAGYSIPITCIWKWETLAIPDHLGNLWQGKK